MNSVTVLGENSPWVTEISFSNPVTHQLINSRRLNPVTLHVIFFLRRLNPVTLKFMASQSCHASCDFFLTASQSCHASCDFFLTASQSCHAPVPPCKSSTPVNQTIKALSLDSDPVYHPSHQSPKMAYLYAPTQEEIDTKISAHYNKGTLYYYSRSDLLMNRNRHVGYDFVTEALKMLDESNETRDVYFVDVSKRLSDYQDAVLTDFGNNPQDSFLNDELKLIAETQKVIALIRHEKFPEYSHDALINMGYTRAAAVFMAAVGRRYPNAPLC